MILLKTQSPANVRITSEVKNKPSMSPSLSYRSPILTDEIDERNLLDERQNSIPHQARGSTLFNVGNHRRKRRESLNVPCRIMHEQNGELNDRPGILFSSWMSSKIMSPWRQDSDAIICKRETVRISHKHILTWCKSVLECHVTSESRKIGKLPKKLSTFKFFLLFSIA